MIEVLMVVALTYTVFQTLFFLNCLSSRRRDRRRLENVFRGSDRQFKGGKDKLDDEDAEDAGRATSVTCTGFREKGSWPRLETKEASGVTSTSAEPTMRGAAPHERQVTRLLVRGSRRSQRRAGLLDVAGNSLAHSVQVQNAIIIMDEEDNEKDHHYMSLKRTSNIYNNLEETHTGKKSQRNYNITVNSNMISVNDASKTSQNREFNLESIESCGDPTSMMTQVTDCDDQEAHSSSSNNSSACSRSNSASGNNDSAGLAVNCAKLMSRASRYSSLDELNEIQETRMDIDDLCSTEDELDAPESSPSQMDMLNRHGSNIDLVSTISQILHSPPDSMKHGFDQPTFTSIDSTASLYSGDDCETGTSRWAHIIPRQGPVSHPTTDVTNSNHRSPLSSVGSSQNDEDSIYETPTRVTELHNTPPKAKVFEMSLDKGLPIIPVEFVHHKNSKRLIKDLPGIHGSLPRRNPQNSLQRQKASSFYTLPRRRPGSDKSRDAPPPPLPPRTLQRGRRESDSSSRSSVTMTSTGSYDPLTEDSTEEETEQQIDFYTKLGLCEHGNVLCDCDGDNNTTDTLVNSYIYNKNTSTSNEQVYENIYEISALNTKETKSDIFEKSNIKNTNISTNISPEVCVFKNSEPPVKSELGLVEGVSKHSKSGSCSGSSGYHDEEEESTASESQTESMSEDSGRGSPEKTEVHSSDESGSLASGEEHHYEDIDPAEMARLRRRDSAGRRKYGQQGSVRASQEEARQRRRLQGLDDLIAGVPPPDYDMSSSHLLTDVSARPDVRTSGPTSSIPPPPEFDNTNNSTQSSSKRQLQSTVSMPPTSSSSSSHQPLTRTTSAPAPPPPPPPMPSTPSPKYSPTSTHKSPSGGSSPDFNSNSSRSSQNDSEDTVKRRNTGSLRGHKKLDRPMSLPLNVAEHYDKMLMDGTKSENQDANYSPTKSRLAGGTNMNFIPPKFETNPEGGLIKPSEYLKSLGPRPAPSLPNLTLNTTSDYNTNDTADESCSSGATLSPTSCLPSIPESTEEEVGKVVLGAGAPPPPPAPPAPPMQSPFNTLSSSKATNNTNTTKKNANNSKTMLPTISVSDLKSVQLKKTEVKSMKSLPLPIRAGMSVPAFAVQKNDVIAELKISQDVGGVRKLKTERAKEEEKITRLETEELKKAFSPDNFVPKIPEKDNAGNHIPEWKRQMLGRRAAEKAKKETSEMLQKELEEKRLQAMPPWKRQLMARHDGDGKRDGLVTPRTQSPVRIVLPTKH